MEPPLLALSAAATGLAVVLVTYVAERSNGTLGGLLATAPVTTAAAILFLASTEGNALVGTHVLRGSMALLAALVGMPVFFAVARWAPLPPRTRTLLAALAFLAVFTALSLAAATLPVALDWVGVPAVLVLAAALAMTFLHLHVPGAPAPDKPPMRLAEATIRFLTGAAVIILIDLLRGVSPALGLAWSVFPGTFLVTLVVLGVRQSPSASARAAQGGVLGAPPLLAYLLVLRLLMPLSAAHAWAWVVQVPAWGAYFLVVASVWRWRQNSALPSRRPAAPAA